MLQCDIQWLSSDDQILGLSLACCNEYYVCTKLTAVMKGVYIRKLFIEVQSKVAP